MTSLYWIKTFLYRIKWRWEERRERRREERTLRCLDLEFYLEQKRFKDLYAKASEPGEQVAISWDERDSTDAYYSKRLPVERSLIAREFNKWHIYELRPKPGRELDPRDITKAWHLIAIARRESRKVWLVTILAAVSALDATINAHSGLISLLRVGHSWLGSFASHLHHAADSAGKLLH